MLGPMRASMLSVKRSTRSVVFLSCINKAVSITAWKRMARAATTTEMTTQVSILPHPRQQRIISYVEDIELRALTESSTAVRPPCFEGITAQRLPLRFRFAEIGFAAGFYGGGNRILLAVGYVFAALDQFVGAFAKFAGFALRVVFAFIGFLGQVLAGVFSGLGSKQNAYQRADAQADEEVTHFGTNIIWHSNLRENRNIGTIRVQYELTGMRYRDRLLETVEDSR